MVTAAGETLVVLAVQQADHLVLIEDQICEHHLDADLVNA